MAVSPNNPQKTAYSGRDQFQLELEAMYQTAPIGLCLLDTDARILRINQYLAELAGLSIEDLAGKNLRDIVPAIAEGAEEIIRTVVETGEPRLNIEIQGETPAQPGVPRYWKAKFWPIKDPEGQVIAINIVVEEITERKQAEESLQQEKERLGSILTALDTGLSLIGRDMTILWVNQKVRDTLPDQEPVGQRCYRLFEGRDSPCEVCPAQQSFATGEVTSIEKYAPANDSLPDRWLHLVSQPVKDESGQVIQALESFTIITERKRAEEALKEYADRLKRSNEDLERFAYISSHDLQEPLRTMVTFTQLLERRYTGQLDPNADEYIQYIVSAGKRMQSLIQDLLEFSRVNSQGGEFCPIDAMAVVDDAITILAAIIPENRATVTYDPLPMVMADATQLRQVFSNLIGNAIKFKKPDVPPEIHISAEKRDGMVQFSVADNGIGIEPQYFDRIFIIFQRLHGMETYEGTGIGLALVKRIIDRHGGTIRVESEIGRGSTFFFTIPAVEY